MLFRPEKLLLLCIFIQQSIMADSYYSQLTNLGQSTSEHNLSNFSFSNCSLYSIAYGSSCTCFDCNEQQCTICCNSPGFTCCHCHACLTSCWNNEWQLISFAQVGLSTALLIATVATIALFFRICNSGLRIGQQQSNSSSRSFIRDSSGRISISSMQQYIIGRLRDRPPRYNDLPDAPPVYDTDPGIRAATLEAPPGYTRRVEPTESTNNQVPVIGFSTRFTNTNTVQLPSTAHHM